jgi:molybdopterin converting factor subunit 1
MVVKVLFFAALYERVGMRQVTMELPEGSTVAELQRTLAERFPQLATYGSSLLFAVNAAYVPSNEPLRDGDEVALIPPVSGGI